MITVECQEWTGVFERPNHSIKSFFHRHDTHNVLSRRSSSRSLNAALNVRNYLNWTGFNVTDSYASDLERCQVRSVPLVLTTLLVVCRKCNVLLAENCVHYELSAKDRQVTLSFEKHSKFGSFNFVFNFFFHVISGFGVEDKKTKECKNFSVFYEATGKFVRNFQIRI